MIFIWTRFLDQGTAKFFEIFDILEFLEFLILTLFFSKNQKSGPTQREKEVLHYEAMQDLNYPRDMPFDGNNSNDDWYYNRTGFEYKAL